jgi:Pentatricopeptide repeat domain
MTSNVRREELSHLGGETETYLDMNVNSTARTINQDHSADLVTYIKSKEIGQLTITEFQQVRELYSTYMKSSKLHNATKVLQRLVDESHTQRNGYDLPITVFNSLIQAWGLKGDPYQAEKVFLYMKKNHEISPARFKAPDMYSYNNLLSAWSKSDLPEAKSRMHAIMEELKESDRLSPDSYSYHFLMSYYANRSTEYGVANKVEDLMLEFSERHIQGLTDKGPCLITFNLLLKAWSKSNEEKGAERALEVYKLMEKMYQQGHLHLRPDESSLVTLMDAFASRGDVSMVESLLQKSASYMDENRLQACLIKALWLSHEPDCGARAEEIYNSISSPNTICQRLVLKAYAYSRSPSAAIECEDFLTRSINAYVTYQTDVPPSLEAFHIVLEGWLRHCDSELAAERSLVLLHDIWSLREKNLIETIPNYTTYSNVIILVAKVKPDQALLVLDEAERQFISPSVEAYNILLLHYGSKQGTVSFEKVVDFFNHMKHSSKINETSYDIMFDLLLKFRTAKSKSLAFQLLQEMEESNTFLPTASNYDSFLNLLLSNTTQADVTVGMQIFDRLRHLEKDPKSKFVLDEKIYCKVFELAAMYPTVSLTTRISRIFDDLLYNESTARHASKYLLSFILCNTRLESKAHLLVAHNGLFRVINLHREGHVEHYPPDSCFLVVLKSWAKADVQIKAKKAFEIFRAIKARNAYVASKSKEHSDMKRDIVLHDEDLPENSNYMDAELHAEYYLNLNNEVNVENLPRNIDHERNMEQRLKADDEISMEQYVDSDPKIHKKHPPCIHHEVYMAFLSVLVSSESIDNPLEAEEVLQFYPLGSVKVWNSMLLIWRNSKVRDKAAHTRRLFQQMKNTPGAAKPNLISYNAVLEAVVRSQTHCPDLKRELFHIARDTYQELKSSDLKPNYASFGLWMKCIRLFTEHSPERNKILASIFLESMDANDTSRQLTRELAKFVSTLTVTEFEELFGNRANDLRWNLRLSFAPEEKAIETFQET